MSLASLRSMAVADVLALCRVFWTPVGVSSRRAHTLVHRSQVQRMLQDVYAQVTGAMQGVYVHSSAVAINPGDVSAGIGHMELI